MKRLSLILILLAFLCAPLVHSTTARCSACCDGCYTAGLIAFNDCRDGGGGDAECVSAMQWERMECANSQCASDNCEFQ